jgi:ABC-type branched-subunit amino acid transport system substrate-binding protein
MGIKKMAIFGSQQSWSMEQTNTFETAFKNLGGKILSKVEPLPGETLLASHAFRLIATKPDAIFISVFAESPIAVKQLAAKKYTGNKFAAAVHPVLLEQARPEFEGTIFNTFTMPTGDFANKYKARFNGEPLVAAGGGYDAVKVINAGIGTSRRYSTLAQAISAVILPGAFGRVEFDEQGCVIREPEALQVKNGNIVPYEGN